MSTFESKPEPLLASMRMRSATPCRLGAMSAIVLIIGCGPLLPPGVYAEAQKGKNYFAGLDAVRSSAPYVSDFVRLFPGAEVNYRYFSPGSGPGFNLVAILHERYELTMQLPVTFDSSGRTVTGYGAPAFYLVEADKVEGRTVSYRPSAARQFGAAGWQKVVESNGNFDAIGYTMIENQPVAGFESLMAPPK